MSTVEPCRGSVDPAVAGRLPCEVGGVAQALELELAGATFEVHGMCEVCQLRSEVAEAADRRRRLYDELLRRSDVSSRLSQFSFDTYPADRVHEAAKHVAGVWLGGYMEGDRRNLYLWGEAGRGKTGLAWSMVRWLIEHAILDDAVGDPRLPATLVNWRLLLARIKDGFSTGERTDAVSRYFNVPVLALDDVGSERPTDFNRDELLTLIDYRYEAQLPIIFTSNREMPELGRQFGHDDPAMGHRLLSRIRENAMVHELVGDDLRLRVLPAGSLEPDTGEPPVVYR